MYGIWHKLKSLKYGVRTLSKKYSDISSRVVEGRSKLGQVLTLLVNGGFHSKSITDAKILNEKMLSLQQVEEEILTQKAKLEWLQLGDGNNSYFNASIRIRLYIKVSTVWRDWMGKLSIHLLGLRRKLLISILLWLVILVVSHMMLML